MRIAQTDAVGAGIEVNGAFRATTCQSLCKGGTDRRINVGYRAQLLCHGDKLNCYTLLGAEHRRNQNFGKIAVQVEAVVKQLHAGSVSGAVHPADDVRRSHLRRVRVLIAHLHAATGLNSLAQVREHTRLRINTVVRVRRVGGAAFTVFHHHISDNRMRKSGLPCRFVKGNHFTLDRRFMFRRVEDVNDQNGACTMVINRIQRLRNGKAGELAAKCRCVFLRQALYQRIDVPHRGGSNQANNGRFHRFNRAGTVFHLNGFGTMQIVSCHGCPPFSLRCHCCFCALVTAQPVCRRV